MLDEPQRARFNQIRYQMLGAVCLSEADPQKTLELSKEQIAQIAGIRSAATSGAFEAMTTPGRESLKKLEAVSAAEQRDLLAVLTEAQLTRYREMLGPAFKNARPKGFVPI